MCWSSSALARAGERLAGALGESLQEAAERAVLKDASIATSLAQSHAMWKLRESVPEAQRHHGASLKHDVSVPISKIPELIERGSGLVHRLAPEGEVVSYGHMGDGNLHFNVSQRLGTPSAAFLARAAPLETAMFDLVESLGGSISAEHGIGRLKAAELARRADPVKLAAMRALKTCARPERASSIPARFSHEAAVLGGPACARSVSRSARLGSTCAISCEATSVRYTLIPATRA